MATGTSSTSGPAPGSVDNANLVSFLGTTRSLTRIWVIIGGVVALLNVLAMLIWILALRFPGGFVGGLVYALIWVAVDLLILERLGGWSAHLSSGHYQLLKEPLLLWAILGIIFGVVPGVLLLIVYVRLLPWSDNPGSGSAETPPGHGAAVPPPPAYSPPTTRADPHESS